MRKLLLTVALLGALGSANAARADFFVTLASVAPAGTDYAYTYDLVFSSVGGLFELADGDFATIYDVEGLVSATAPLGFSVSIQNIGINAFQTAPTDDPALPNVTFTRTGGAVAADQTFQATIVSIYNAVKDASYTAQETSVGPPVRPKGNVGTVDVPTVPEPGSLALLGLGTVGLLGLRWRRQLRQAQA